MITYRCSRCGKIVPTGKKCDCVSAVKKARDRDYNKNWRDKKSQDFYTSREWKRIRDFIMLRYDGVDVYEYAETGEIIKADVVHHIIPLSEDTERRLDESNLIPLSHASHNHIHDVYDKGEDQKREMQNRLRECIEQYVTE